MESHDGMGFLLGSDGPSIKICCSKMHGKFFEQCGASCPSHCHGGTMKVEEEAE
jgi:hypothetical protein